MHSCGWQAKRGRSMWAASAAPWRRLPPTTSPLSPSRGPTRRPTSKKNCAPPILRRLLLFAPVCSCLKDEEKVCKSKHCTSLWQGGLFGPPPPTHAAASPLLLRPSACAVPSPLLRKSLPSAACVPSSLSVSSILSRFNICSLPSPHRVFHLLYLIICSLLSSHNTFRPPCFNIGSFLSPHHMFHPSSSAVLPRLRSASLWKARGVERTSVLFPPSLPSLPGRRAPLEDRLVARLHASFWRPHSSSTQKFGHQSGACIGQPLPRHSSSRCPCPIRALGTLKS
jgi:hypothetical protein